MSNSHFLLHERPLCWLFLNGEKCLINFLENIRNFVHFHNEKRSLLSIIIEPLSIIYWGVRGSYKILSSHAIIPIIQGVPKKRKTF